MPDKKNIIYRRATRNDLVPVRSFVDFWLSGRAKGQGIKNAGNDYFVTTNQHKAYFRSCIVYVALDGEKIVGWAVKQRSNVLIHLLVAGDYRGKKIGRELMDRIKPDIIRSKTDQQTGDPFSFYEKLGYRKIGRVKVGKKKNIEFLTK